MKAPEDIINELYEVLESANSLCRSAYSIAQRKGIQTNWETFERQLKESLDRQHKVMYPAPEAEPFPPSPQERWVPVSERLPEIDTKVRVLHADGSELVGAILTRDGNWWWRGQVHTRITHWLPAPPAQPSPQAQGEKK